MPLTGTPAANKAVVQGFFDAVVQGDQARLEALLDPELTWWVLGFGERSRADFLSALLRTIGGASERAMHIVGMTAEGDRVAVEAQGRMVFPHAVYANTYHNLFVVRDGRIVHGREYMDTALAQRVFNPGATAS